ncbi:MAG: tyrosine-type recombinase/integrase [Anaerolineales bacterium]|nr:tyrosine-type recombinase/integrase [Anaerolineales bacterium]
MSVEQLPLFSLTRESPLSAAINGFHEHMIRKGFTENTIKAFLNDLRILTRYLGDDHPLSQIGTSELNDFMTYLRHYRGVPCNPKSYARRMTTLKVFFGWLAEEGIIPSDPAAPLIHQRASTPLPQILYQGQVEKLLQATEGLMHADKPDARPHLLVTFLLQTGIKKGECMAIQLNDIDTSEPKAPVLYIRYSNPKMKHKERKLGLSADFVPILQQYLAEYQPKERLFECTARNLEYVLDNAARLAGLETISFEILRWTCAVRDYKAKMPSDKLRQKLGLSRITWQEEALEKLKKLASPPL